MEQHWKPMLDDDGEPIPVVYTFDVFDEYEQQVGKSTEQIETKPVLNRVLKGEARRIAAEYIATYPECAPWFKWFVSINSTGTTAESVEQEQGYYFLDLVNHNIC